MAAVRAVSLAEGDVVAISGAAGGVGTLAVQLARDAGATVIGLAGEHHHEWLREHGAIPVTYGDGVGERIREAGGGASTRSSTPSDPATSIWRSSSASRPSGSTRSSTGTRPRRHGVRTDGNMAGASADTLADLARLIAEGRLEIPIARVYPLAEVRDAFRELERRHTLGKIVLRP